MEGHHLLRGETDEVVPENRQLESSLGPQYGTVATGMGSTRPHRNGPRKRYRLSLLIVMSFDATLLVFLSILSYLTLYKDSKVQSYFTDLSVKTSVFDIVMIAFIRFVVLLLFYLVLAWVTRVVFMVTIVISTFYVPIKAYFLKTFMDKNEQERIFSRMILQGCGHNMDSLNLANKAVAFEGPYCEMFSSKKVFSYMFWTNLYSKDGTVTDIQFIIVLIFLFAAFVMPWLLAFFFEFKFLPAELSRLSTTQWTNWRVWCCPWMLVKPPPMQSTSAANRASTAISHSQPLARYSSMDTVFRTPMGSIRGSPPPVEHEELSLIREEGTDSPISTPLPECDQFSSENEQYTLCAAQAIEKLEQMTRSNNGWILEKEEDGIKCYSFRNNSHAKKIWKSETVINVAVEALWRVLYHETHRTTEWNTNVDVNEVVHHIDRTTDIMYTAIKPVAMVTARDFVTVRKASVRRGCYYCASVSVTFIGKPPVPEKIRGDNGPCGYVLIPLDSTRTLFKWVIDSDMKGWIPQGIIDQNFTNTLVSANTNLRVLMNART